MAGCRQLSPCFPIEVIRTLSQRDRRLYILFHLFLWLGTLTFFACLAVYAVQRNYLYFILPLPCIILMFGGLFGFRWLAIRNNDKFELLHRHHESSSRRRTASRADRDAEAAAAMDGFPPPPPVYSVDYDGPIFTIYGSLVPPPSYDELMVAATSATTDVTATAASLCSEQQQQQQQLQEQEQHHQQQHQQQQQQQQQLGCFDGVAGCAP